MQQLLVPIGLFVAFAFLLLTIFTFLARYKRCPSDKILVVYGRVAGKRRGGPRHLRTRDPVVAFQVSDDMLIVHPQNPARQDFVPVTHK